MKVTLIASTTVHAEAFDILSLKAPGFFNTPTHAEYLTEFAGRACYQSWSRPNAATRDTRDYIRSAAIDKGHGSILEHATATFYIEGVSRSLTHELIRHRAGTGFSELSQRYVDVADVSFVLPPAMRDAARKVYPDLTDEQIDEQWQAGWKAIGRDYSDGVDILMEDGVPRKQAREAARCVMPNATETKIVMTANLRAWRHILRLRGSEHADAEIRELAIELLDKLYDVAPAAFSDFDVITLPDGRQVIE